MSFLRKRLGEFGGNNRNEFKDAGSSSRNKRGTNNNGYSVFNED